MKNTFNLISRCTGKLSCMRSNHFFSGLGNRVLLSLILILSVSQNPVYSQNDFCGFDKALHEMMDDYPEMQQIMESNEKAVQKMISKYPKGTQNGGQKSGGTGVYSIPVVFHVIHLGEPIGSGTNIDDAPLLQALQDLNANFRDAAGLGTDVEIEFCLAQRKPNGEPSTGINRVNGYGVGNYENIGIASHTTIHQFIVRKTDCCQLIGYERVTKPTGSMS
ncbi:MAG TPA: hypothetical protein ENJ95_16985, partial [Bacteroidetes bacterium]|nr:hypothetical protein [Bacteroidota bacterium]